MHGFDDDEDICLNITDDDDDGYGGINQRPSKAIKVDHKTSSVTAKPFISKQSSNNSTAEDRTLKRKGVEKPIVVSAKKIEDSETVDKATVESVPSESAEDNNSSSKEDVDISITTSTSSDITNVVINSNSKTTSDKINTTTSTAEVPAVKPKKQWSAKSDPALHHANPRYLSKDTLSRPRETVAFSDLIFSRLSFQSLNLHPKLIEILHDTTSQGGLNLTTSTRIQSVTIPILNNHQNMLMKSQTGSGKTLAYLLPILNDLMKLSPQIQRVEGTRALIIAPTRELCSQITDILQKLTQACVYIVGGLITGGEKRKSEKARLRKGVVVLVSTPGRLLDHLKATESFALPNLSWLVLDEADRLLDMGFEQTILEIMSIIQGRSLPGLKNPLNLSLNNTSSFSSKKCVQLDQLVHVMVSATMTKAVQELAFVSLMNNTNSNTSDKNSATVAATNSGNISDKQQFLVVDADCEHIHTVQTLDDIFKASNHDTSNNNTNKLSSTTASTNKVNNNKYQPDANGVISFEDPNDDDNNEYNTNTANKINEISNILSHSNPSHRSMLTENERIDTPHQLAQYYMNVTCKWRLAALMSFLRTKVTIEKLKVMVFFSTCDAVDYHTLLLRETEWPTQMDNGDSINIGSNDSGSGGSIYHDNSNNSNDDDYENIGGINMSRKRGKSTIQDKNNTSNNNKNINNNNSNTTASSSSSTSSNSRANSLRGLGSSISDGLLGKGNKVFRLHGNMGHATRQQVYRDFCALDSSTASSSSSTSSSSIGSISGKTSGVGSVLLCTDVAARGLDLPKVDWILQYDPPCDITDYAHRAGRTARRGLGGSALLFLLPAEAAFIPLLNSHHLKPEALSLQSLFLDVSQEIPGAQKFKNVDELSAVILQRRLEVVVEKNKFLVAAGQQTFRSYVRAYATHSADTKGIFKVQQLHLGHVAKSFALRTNPNAMQSKHDVIGEIANGKYDIALIEAAANAYNNNTSEEQKAIDKKLKEQGRNEKYSLSSKSNNNNNKKNGSNSISSNSTGGGIKYKRQEEKTVKSNKRLKPDKTGDDNGDNDNDMQPPKKVIAINTTSVNNSSVTTNSSTNTNTNTITDVKDVVQKVHGQPKTIQKLKTYNKLNKVVNSRNGNNNNNNNNNSTNNNKDNNSSNSGSMTNDIIAPVIKKKANAKKSIRQIMMANVNSEFHS